MPQESGNLVVMIGYLVVFLGVMYLLIFRPQKKREKKTREMLDALSVGDEVVTIGGISGKVINMKDDEITIETGIEKTKLNFKKWGIKEVKELIKA